MSLFLKTIIPKRILYEGDMPIKTLTPKYAEAGTTGCYTANVGIIILLYKKLICDYIFYFGQKPEDVISWAEKPDELLNKIDNNYE